MEEQQDQHQAPQTEPIVITPGQDPTTLNISHDVSSETPQSDSAPAQFEEIPEQSATETPQTADQQPEQAPPEVNDPAPQNEVLVDDQPAPETDTNNQQWQHQSGQLTADQPDETNKPQSQESFSWSAADFEGHQKTPGWYMALGLVVVAISVVIYFITRDVISVVVVAIIAVIIGMFASLKPKTFSYSVDSSGVTIGQKHFAYTEFKSFAVIDEGSRHSIQLLPQKRFMIAITMYFDSTDGEKITQILGEFLPFEHKERDLVDRLSSKIHF